jgi:glycogen debranching enzyme
MALDVLESISNALEDQGVGTIGEIFEGDPPHHPRGAPAQAWSVGCTLDAWRLLSQALHDKQPGNRRETQAAGREPPTDVASH